MRLFLLLAGFLALVPASQAPASQTQAPQTSVSSAPAAQLPAEPVPGEAPNCGYSTGDWCPAATGDPCGAHRDVEACRADDRCYGMPYLGESFVACRLDARGFGLNCPTVGCTSVPPESTEEGEPAE